MNTPKTTFNVYFLGDCKVGKSALLSRLETGEFDDEYCPSEVIEECTLDFHTNQGTYTFSASAYSGDDDEYAEFRHQHGYPGADCAVIMFDKISRASFENVDYWFNEIRQVCPNIPIVLVANKCDVTVINIGINAIRYKAKQLGIQWIDVSVKNGQNLEEPFLYLLRELTQTGHNLHFVEAPSVIPQPIDVDYDDREADDNDNDHEADDNYDLADDVRPAIEDTGLDQLLTDNQGLDQEEILRQIQQRPENQQRVLQTRINELINRRIDLDLELQQLMQQLSDEDAAIVVAMLK